MGKERVSDDDKSRRLRRKKCAPSGAIDNIIGSQLLQNETTKYNCRHRNNKKVRFTTLTLQPCYFIFSLFIEIHCLEFNIIWFLGKSKTA